MAGKDVASMFAVALFIGAFVSVPTSVQSIGVCYGVIANNLPPANDVVQLYRSKGITGMRIYFADAKALSALRNSGISLILDKNVRPYYPAVNIKYIAAGNEVQGGATQSIVPAMRNLNAALSAAGLGAIKVSTSIRFDEVAKSFPPSEGVFANAYMTDVARLLASTGAPLLANVYPYFAYKRDPQNIKLNYATFRPGPTVRDDKNGLTYTCLFDAMVDAVVAALEKAGAPGVRVVVSESGWPSASGFAATADNARAYNQGLIDHVGGGTPKRRGALETYIFGMFNENFKRGELVEKHFGLFNPDKSPAYPIQFK
ncbi:unnamed protein product [Triticum turgidum subsp. durum]|uniref:Glucan endo-1,3-beta-D-glucosidase n=1 Tax=Triticum turgidum subsp. durum TaxID=4567 RepID=A0A9R0VTF8_TRITD|nr:unnamed protein product [Triticum turgidum subsp. durum]